MSDTTDQCPHGIEKRQWGFRDDYNYQPHTRALVILNAESCPGCLGERVKTLRAIIEKLLNCTAVDRNGPSREQFNRAMDAYHKDLTDHY